MARTRPLDGLVAMNVPHPAVFRHVLRYSWAQRGRSWYVGFFQLPWLPEALLTAGGAPAPSPNPSTAWRSTRRLSRLTCWNITGGTLSGPAR